MNRLIVEKDTHQVKVQAASQPWLQQKDSEIETLSEAPASRQSSSQARQFPASFRSIATAASFQTMFLSSRPTFFLD
jgi:hypothetical protein